MLRKPTRIGHGVVGCRMLGCRMLAVGSGFMLWRRPRRAVLCLVVHTGRLPIGSTDHGLRENRPIRSFREDPWKRIT